MHNVEILLHYLFSNYVLESSHSIFFIDCLENVRKIQLDSFAEACFVKISAEFGGRRENNRCSRVINHICVFLTPFFLNVDSLR